MQDIMFIWDKLDLVAQIDEPDDGAGSRQLRLGKRGSGNKVYFCKKVVPIEVGKCCNDVI